jgi:nucleoside-diphosphate-sugar epimerase
MKITILGSSGQVGAYLTKYLRDKSYDVTEFDITNGKEEDLTVIPNYYLEKVIKDSDFVFFLAFDVGGSRYLKKYQHTFPFINNNTRLMANVFSLLQQYNKKFIFASSQMSNMTYSPYGVLKNVGELYTKTINGLIVKFWNVYGIENDYEKFHVITDFIHKGLKTGTIDMLTDGQEERDFLYAEDCCEALEVIMNSYNEFTSNDNLHITSFKSTKIVDIASIIVDEFKSIGRTVRMVPSEQKDTVQMDKRNQPDTYLSKWWVPKTSIKDGIKKVFEAVIKN